MFEALARLAEQNRTPEKNGQPWATRATKAENTQCPAVSGPLSPVAQVVQNGQPTGNRGQPLKPAETLDFSGLVAQVAQVAQKNEQVARARGGDTWDADGWRGWITERAAILEFDCGLPRLVADRQAFQHAIVEWLNRHPAMTDPHVCAGCGGTINEAGTDWRPLADGATVHYGGGHRLNCWERHGARRRVEAEAALAALGVKL